MHTHARTQVVVVQTVLALLAFLGVVLVAISALAGPDDVWDSSQEWEPPSPYTHRHASSSGMHERRGRSSLEAC